MLNSWTALSKDSSSVGLFADARIKVVYFALLIRNLEQLWSAQKVAGGRSRGRAPLQWVQALLWQDWGRGPWVGIVSVLRAHGHLLWHRTHLPSGATLQAILRARPQRAPSVCFPHCRTNSQPCWFPPAAPRCFPH